jgi:hypothetical protein
MLLDSDKIVRSYFRRGFKPVISSLMVGTWQVHPLTLLYIEEFNGRPENEDEVIDWANEKFGERNLQGLIEGLEGHTLRSGVSIRALLEGRKLRAKLQKVHLLSR